MPLGLLFYNFCGDFMLGFKSDIKEQILMAVGVTLSSYEEVASKNKYGYDPLDKCIITSASKLNDRLRNTFALLYKCHSEEEVANRVREDRLNTIKKIKTIGIETVRKYERDCKRELVDKIIKSPDKFHEVKKIVGD